MASATLVDMLLFESCKDMAFSTVCPSIVDVERLSILLKQTCAVPINPSQLWIRMQFAPELEEPQAFNWFPVVLVVVVGK